MSWVFFGKTTFEKDLVMAVLNSVTAFSSFLLFSVCSGLLVPIDKSGKMTDSRFSGNQETPLHWRNIAKEDLNRRVNWKPNVGVAKNVVFFLGDGMGISTVTAARILKGQLQGRTGEEGQLAWDKFPNAALSRTYNQDHTTPDSAGTGTQYLCGVKSNMGMLGMEARVKRGDCEASKDAHLTSIYNWSVDKGKSVGLVTTTRVTHATPAAGYAKVADRNWEGDSAMRNVSGKGCKDIALQLVEDNPDIKVIMGGGRWYFKPNNTVDPENRNMSEHGRQDGRDLVKEWMKDKEQRNLSHRYVWNATEFDTVDPTQTEYLLGLFDASHMQYELDRKDPKYEVAGEPSIAEMTKKAIQVLQRNHDKGFFLLVEGGRIDLAHHANEPERALHDVLAMEKAVETAMSLTSKDDTLIVVTADHSHTFVLSGYPSRGNPILGLVDDVDGNILMAEDGKPYTTLQYTNGPGAIEMEALLHHGTYKGRANLTSIDTASKDFQTQSAVPLLYETHAGEDVGIYARGPMSHLFHGVHEQHYIPHAMAFASCVGDYKDDANCAASLATFTSAQHISDPQTSLNSANTLSRLWTQICTMLFVIVLQIS
ncbi:alkaline phosphatase-like [Mizuhopecten yessoensis]|uniref:Alkaline phosphatase, tissue-nonspecific isozyme n=1 Tax=Mizuhopecten yessoensis TaxID=6573 RepID=A0A210R4T9_MIZYE|nr:alkaline phosphatase-like [Mizuhopecten yessoensis]OWF56050.1 Alkaline phosphatase, tissue-nonspecific isozyme [Mizuhopecten yessoensis]